MKKNMYNTSNNIRKRIYIKFDLNSLNICLKREEEEE